MCRNTQRAKERMRAISSYLQPPGMSALLWVMSLLTFAMATQQILPSILSVRPTVPSSFQPLLNGGSRFNDNHLLMRSDGETKKIIIKWKNFTLRLICRAAALKPIGDENCTKYLKLQEQHGCSASSCCYSNNMAVCVCVRV